MNTRAHFDKSALAPSNFMAVQSASPQMKMASNIGRDIIKRAQGFNEMSTALFEYMANAYEAYNVGQLANVWVEIEKNQIVIRDHGVGMSYLSMCHYWTMHGETNRRENGLNLRGYNGTGKIAGFRVANSVTVRTVRDGLRQTTRLTYKAIEAAARNNTTPDIEVLECNVETTEQNGTTVILKHPRASVLPQGFNAALIREVREKIEKEMMMWMKNAQFFVNGVQVFAAEVPFEQTKTVTSDCGNYTAEFKYLEKGYRDELPHVFINIGDIFVAHEQFGKENHRLGSRVHVVTNTTKTWSQAHFEHCREQFCSESRDLKFKANCAEAIDLKNWITGAVAAYMQELEALENERRQAEMDDAQRALEERMSMSLSALFRTLHRKTRENNGRSPNNPKTGEVAPRAEPKQKINMRCEKFTTDEQRYRYNSETLEIVVNTNYGHMKKIEDHTSVVYDQAILESSIAAMVEMEAERSIRDLFKGREANLDMILREAADTRCKIEHTAFNLFSSTYESYRKLSVSKSATQAVEA